MATVGNLNGMINIGVQGIPDVLRLESAYQKLRAAQNALSDTPSPRAVAANALSEQPGKGARESFSGIIEAQYEKLFEKAIAIADAKERQLEIDKRISAEMSVQAAEAARALSAPTKSDASQTRFAQMLRDEEELGRRRLAINERISAINARTTTVSSGSRFDNANPFAQQVMATQKLNALLAKRKALTDDLARAENRLAITQQVAEVRALRAGLTADSAINRLRNFGNTAADSQKKYAKFGVVMQQTGYQVQDFAVQVAGGQSAMVALSQQGAQWLGLFGAGGAIAGAALSAGILGARLLGLNDTMAKQKVTVDELADSFRKLAIAKNESLAGGFAKLDTKNAQKSYDDQAKIVSRIEKQLADFNATKQTKLAENVAIPGYAAGLANMGAALSKQLDAEYEKLKTFQDELNKVSVPTAELDNKTREAVNDELKLNAERIGKELKLEDEKAKKLVELDKWRADKARARMDLLAGDMFREIYGPQFDQMAEQAQRNIRIPQAMQFTGARSTGGLVGSAGGDEILSINRKMLKSLESILNNTAIMAGNN